ncbi:MAG: PH (pleckstrin homology) domain-containing protein [Amphiamblys sp. WSBS2006]|nr:MAG: PH (pleckstrin homology) domain-containing protein [Amphiamblys sp. WSBS2006]
MAPPQCSFLFQIPYFRFEEQPLQMLAGYLNKSKRSGNGWVKRWFVLREEKIAYYENEKEALCRDIIDIEKIFAVNEVLFPGRKNVFCLLTAERVYFLEAQDRETMDLWVCALIKEIQKHKTEKEKIERHEKEKHRKKRDPTSVCIEAHTKDAAWECENHRIIKRDRMKWQTLQQKDKQEWQDCVCVLYNGFIIVTIPEGKNIVIPLDQILAIHKTGEDVTERFCFLIITERDINVFSVETAEEREMWNKEIELAMKTHAVS